MSHVDRLRAAADAAVDAEVQAIVDGAVSPVQLRLDATAAELVARTAERDEARAQVAERDLQVGALTAEVARLRKRIEELEAGQPEPEPQPEPTPGLWWQRQPSREDMPVMAHVTPWSPAMVSNEPMSSDYYARNWLTLKPQSSVEQAHAAYGARMRDAPRHRAPYPGNTTAAKRTAAVDEIATAVAFGIDGFFIDATNSGTTRETNGHWEAIAAYLDAARDFPGFRVVPMIDCNGGIADHSNNAIVAYLRRYLDVPSAWTLPDGRKVVGVFHATSKAAKWPQSRFDEIAKALGGDIAYVGAFVDVSYATQYPSFYAVGPWSGGADPAALTGAVAGAEQARRRGQRVLLPAVGQNVRPQGGGYDEARGLAAMAASWDQIERETAHGGAPLVQVVTWCDWAEGSAVYPGRGQGAGPLTYLAWRADCWRAGRELPILADHVILSQRVRTVGAQITGGQTRRMTQYQRGSRTTSRDEVGVTTLLTAPARVTVLASERRTEYDAPAGEHMEFVPAGAGRVQVVVTRDGKTVARIDSPLEIRDRAPNDHPGWFHVATTDPTPVYDPTPGS